jgi:urease gamma subunit
LQHIHRGWRPVQTICYQIELTYSSNTCAWLLNVHLLCQAVTMLNLMPFVLLLLPWAPTLLKQSTRSPAASMPTGTLLETPAACAAVSAILQEKIYTPDQITELMSVSDYVVAATPYTPATDKLVSAAAIAAMKPNGVFINVGRGKCVDEEALIQGGLMLTQHMSLSVACLRGCMLICCLPLHAGCCQCSHAALRCDRVPCRDRLAWHCCMLQLQDSTKQCALLPLQEVHHARVLHCEQQASPGCSDCLNGIHPAARYLVDVTGMYSSGAHRTHLVFNTPCVQ